MPTTVSKCDYPNVSPYRGDRWYATLMSLTVLDQGQSNGVIATDPRPDVITFSVTYLTRKDALWGLSTGQFQDQGVQCGIGRYYECKTTCYVWQPVLETDDVYNTIMVKLMYEQGHTKTFNGDERPLVSVKNNWIPTMTWKEDALILHAVPKGELLNGKKTKAMTTFSIHVGVAETFGVIEQTPRSGGVCIGSQSPIHPSLRDL